MNTVRVALDEVLASVSSQVQNVRNHYEVTAILEAMGWTDKQAAEQLGYDSVFELARDLYPLLRRAIPVESFYAEQKRPLLVSIWMAINSFFRGILFAIPMAVSVMAYLILRYSLWASDALTLELATAVVLGTVLSFVVTGGFTQAIARRGMMYLGQNEYNLSRRLSFIFVRIGLVVTALTGLTVTAIFLIFEIFPVAMVAYMMVYYAFLATMWLSVTIHYILRQGLLFSGFIIGGIGLVMLLHAVGGLDIVVSQIIALSTVALLSMVVAFYNFRREERRMAGEKEVALPRMSVVVYTVLPYFGYGFLFFSFIFLDRIIGWSCISTFMPYFIWFRGEYELGHDFALLAAVIPMGVVEAMINSGMDHLRVLYSRYTLRESDQFISAYRKYYLKQFLWYLVLSALSGLVIYYIIMTFPYARHLFIGVRVPGTGRFVFTYSIIGYVLLVAGLMNCLFMFCLSQPRPVLHALGSGILVNFSLGFVLSRTMGYHMAVIGMLVGSGVFAGLSTRGVLKLLSDLDYYVYYPL